ncbi:MAG TPA: hypothetical protein VK674_00365 [Candidatus Limnocylindria bacterium]|nr:hypothetical protein [Candidatus Limnocylindria bacterium]
MRHLHASLEEIKVQEAYGIGLAAKASVDQQYGTGFPHFASHVDERGNILGPDTPYAYHNGFHTRSGEEDAVRLGMRLGYGPAKLALLGATLDTHDLIFTGNRGPDEEASAQLLVEDLQGVNEHYGRTIFGDREIVMGELGVKGTTAEVDESGVLLGQLAASQDYPDAETQEFALAVTCADTGRLYTPDGPRMGHAYYRELIGRNLPGDVVPIDDRLVEFQNNQVTLLENYQYPLPEADEVLSTHRQEVIDYSGALAGDLAAGTIENWDEIAGRDASFFVRPRGDR